MLTLADLKFSNSKINNLQFSKNVYLAVTYPEFFWGYRFAKPKFTMNAVALGAATIMVGIFFLHVYIGGKCIFDMRKHIYFTVNPIPNVGGNFTCPPPPPPPPTENRGERKLKGVNWSPKFENFEKLC